MTADPAQAVVGVLGGMGPEATIDLMRRVLAATPATDDADHLRMLVDNNPKVPSRVAALIEGTGPSPAPTLIAMARGLQAQGADYLVMPCNTAHYYHAEVAAAVDVPFLNLMELVAQRLAQVYPEVRRVGLLASSALRSIRAYEPWLTRVGVDTLYPDSERQAALMSAIRAVKASGARAEHVAAFNDAARQLGENQDGNRENTGPQLLLIACTELSVIADTLRTELPVLDAADVLAAAIVERSRGP